MREEVAFFAFYIVEICRVHETSLPIRALKIKDAAHYLGGVAPVTVRRLIKRGLLKPNRALRHVLIPISELDRFLGGGLHERRS
jgi:hypothetical protein